MQEEGALMIKKIGKYLFNILVSIDQLANTILGGDPDETISSRVGKLRKKRVWAEFIASILDRFDYKHSERAIEEDEGKNRVVE